MSNKMKKYEEFLRLELVEGYRFKTLEPVRLSSRAGVRVHVPVGFITDLASVPRCLWWWFPPHGKWAVASVVHDYMYEQAISTKEDADNTFFKLLRIYGVPKTKARLMYWAVRLFGRGNYKKPPTKRGGARD